jgi:DNA-binding NtrC family response regulator
MTPMLKHADEKQSTRRTTPSKNRPSMSLKDLDSVLAELSEPSSGQSSSRAEAPKSERLPLVLVVDDDDGMREALNLLLSGRYRVLSCSSAVAGLEAFTDDVCVVILDVKMRGQDGFWACDQIRKRQPDIPIIFYSAYQDVKNPFDIINSYRPFGYLTKDGNSSKLLSTVELAAQLFQSTLRSRRIIERLKRKRADATR